MQRWHRLAIDFTLNITSGSVPNDANVIPAVRGWKSRRPFKRADTHALTAENVKDSVVHRLPGRRIGREMNVVEMRRVAIAENDHERPFERTGVCFYGYFAEGRGVRQSELERPARAWQRFLASQKVQYWSAVFVIHLPIRGIGNTPFMAENFKRIGGLD
jgi:hypothetical protein